MKQFISQTIAIGTERLAFLSFILQVLRNCILRIICVCSIFCSIGVSGNLAFPYSAFSVFSACSVFQFRIHKLYNISLIVVYISARYFDFALTLQKIICNNKYRVMKIWSSFRRFWVLKISIMKEMWNFHTKRTY